MGPDRRIAGMDLPRQNGELVFAAPWEARAFGLAVALNEQGQYAWGEFSSALAARITAEAQHSAASSYYERWLESLEKLAIERGLVTREELDARTAECAARDDHEH